VEPLGDVNKGKGQQPPVNCFADPQSRLTLTVEDTFIMPQAPVYTLLTLSKVLLASVLSRTQVNSRRIATYHQPQSSGDIVTANGADAYPYQLSALPES